MLAQFEQLLAAHAAAVREGDADALPALAQALRGQLSALTRQPLPAAERARLQALLQQCARQQLMLQRRVQEMQRRLQALADAVPQAPEAPPTYGAQGFLAAPLRRSRGFAAA